MAHQKKEKKLHKKFALQILYRVCVCVCVCVCIFQDGGEAAQLGGIAGIAGIAGVADTLSRAERDTLVKETQQKRDLETCACGDLVSLSRQE